MMRVCPRRHPAEGKVCLECGYIFPLEVGATVGPFTIQSLLASRADANLYLIVRDQQAMALWECRELFQASYRQQLFDVLSSEPVPNLIPSLGHFGEPDVPGGPLLYFLQPATTYQQGQSLEQYLRQGMAEPSLVKRWLSQILLALQALEERNFCLNTVGSHMIQIMGEDAFLCFPAYGNLLAEVKPLGLRVMPGFSPPEGIRSGYLYRETDRFGLAMVMFHLLTGLSPVLWSPDVPKLKYYQYLWGKEVILFFNALLEPYPKYSTRELLVMLDKISFKPSQPVAGLRQETQRFYRAVDLAAQGLHFEAAEQLLPILEGKLHNPHVFRLLGDIHWEREEEQETVLAYAESSRREKLGGTYLKLGRFYLHVNETTRASKAFRQALRYIPYDPEPYRHIGHIEMAAERYQQAEIWLRKSYDLRKTHETKQLLEKLEYLLNPGKTTKVTRSGFALKYHHWDKNFKEQLEEFRLSCPEGHPQNHEGLTCEVCQRPMHYLPGETIRDYQIQEVLTKRDLKQQHNSSTYLALTAEGQKVLLKELPADSSGRQRFSREIRALSMLSHPAIPQLIDQFEFQGHYYLIQSFCEGQNLETLIRQQGPLPETVVRTILSQALEVLAEFEQHDLIHSDIKPKNLLWNTQTQQLSVLDFDVSVLIVGAERIASIGFTEHYAAYEQRFFNWLCRQSDAVNLGLTALFLLSGFTPELFFYQHPLPLYKRWQPYAACSTPLKSFLEELIVCIPEERNWKDISDLQRRWQKVESLPAFSEVPAENRELVVSYYAFHKDPDLNKIRQGTKKLLGLRTDSKTNFLVGHEFVKAGQDLMAEGFLKSAVVLDPEWPHAYMDLAGLYSRTKQWGKTIELLQNSLKFAGEQASTLLHLARSYRQMGYYPQAFDTLKRAIRRAPQDIDILLEQAHLELLMNSLEAARKHCESVLSLEPKSARAYQLLQMIFSQRGHFKEAIEFGKRALALAPDHILLYYDLGLSYFRDQQFQEALKMLVECVKRAPDLWDAYYFIGVSQIHLGMYLEAYRNLLLAQRSGKQTELIQEKLDILRQYLPGLRVEEAS